MIAVALALLGAVSYGVSDFIGGLASRRTSVWPVAFLACTGGFLCALLLASAVPGNPRPQDFAWGFVSGLGSGAGVAFLYRGLAGGRMGVVAPVSGVGATALPVLIGVLGGERPAVLVWCGMLAALPGIWLVSREESREEADAMVDPRAGGSGLLDGVLAGVGFGLMFATLGQVPASAGYWPFAANQLASVLSVTAACLLLGGSPVPRSATPWWGLLSGVLAAAAGLGFLLATHRGLLSVSAVLVSLYPAFTVLLAAFVLRERIHGVQASGLALCGLAVVLVAAG